MSGSRTVRWSRTKPTRRPKRAAVRAFLEDFIGDPTAVRWKGRRFFVDIPGKGSDALRRVAERNAPELYQARRWVEVWFERRSIEIMTRGHDQFTSAIAEGLADGIAGFWRGRRD